MIVTYFTAISQNLSANWG